MLEWYEDLYDEKEGLVAQLAAGAVGAEASVISQRLNAIQDALGVTDSKRVITGDPLIDYWEAEIRAGRTPDLDMQLEDIPHGR